MSSVPPENRGSVTSGAGRPTGGADDESPLPYGAGENATRTPATAATAPTTINPATTRGRCPRCSRGACIQTYPFLFLSLAEIICPVEHSSVGRAAAYSPCCLPCRKRKHRTPRRGSRPVRQAFDRQSPFRPPPQLSSSAPECHRPRSPPKGIVTIWFS